MALFVLFESVDMVSGESVTWTRGSGWRDPQTVWNVFDLMDFSLTATEQMVGQKEGCICCACTSLTTTMFF